VEAVTTPVAKKVSPELEELIARAEAAIAGKPYVGDSKTETAHSPTESVEPRIYTAPLPIGFEPPPGYIRPSPLKEAVTQPAELSEAVKPVSLPLVAPAVSSLAESEPIISHLAGTIDNLASYLATNPTAATKAADVLETAKGDLTALADRFEKVREVERQSLEAKLDEQIREYSMKLLELEIEAQDKLDGQQEDFNRSFEEERSKIIQAYRQKLHNELRTQTELINERYAIFILNKAYHLQSDKPIR
jgi:mitofilin